MLYPSDAVSTERLVALMAYHPGLAYMRTSRPKTPVIYSNDETFTIGGSKVLRESDSDVATVIGAGVTLFEALKAYDQLKAAGTSIRVIDLYSVAPIDRDGLVKAGRATKGRLITVEDHYAAGGIGDAVAYWIAASPWIEAKAFATASPAALALAAVGCAGLASSGGQIGYVQKVIGGRVERWRHVLYEAWRVNKLELAVLAELLLRGAQTEGELNTAVETNQDDLAVVLIQKKNQLAADITELKADMETAHSDADSAKTSLLSVQSEIKKLKAERDSMLAKMQSAQARLKIQEQLDGLSVDDEVRALDNVRTHIKNTIAEANLTKELSDSSRDSRLAALRSQTGDVTAKQELAALKARKAAQSAQQQKTM